MVREFTKEETGLPFFIEDFLYKDMTALKEIVSHKHTVQDAVIIITGKEGSGKTTIGKQMYESYCKITGREVNVKDWFWNAEELMDSVMMDDAPRGTPFCYDEAVLSFMAKEGQKKENKQMEMMFNMCRSKGYVFFIIMPRYDQMPKWMAVGRSLAMYRCYTKDKEGGGRDVGYFVGYPQSQLEKYYMALKNPAKKQRPENVPHTKEGKFTPYDPFGDEFEAYKQNNLRTWYSGLRGGKKTPERGKLDHLEAGLMKLEALGVFRLSELEKLFELQTGTIAELKRGKQAQFKPNIRERA